MILSFCVTHKKASVPILESLIFKDKKQALKALSSFDFVQECVLIQTCNRVEIHLITSETSAGEVTDRLVRFWSQNANVSKDIVFKLIEVFEGHEALKHLLLLASGLESMVVGEDQILGQIREAYLESKEDGTTKSLFDTVFLKTLNAGRKVRTETGVNNGSVSISSIAISLAEKHLGDLTSAKALIIGAGETGTLAAKELSRRNIGSIYVTNRTYKKGVALAKMIGAQSIRFEEIYDYLPIANLVIAAVSVSAPLLTSKKVTEALKSVNTPSNLLILDLSQPRCVEESVGRLSGVNLRTIDDLKETVEENLQKRLDETIKARKIVDEELDHLEALLKKMAAEPIISSLCKKVDKIRCNELSKALHMINGINDDQRLVIENLTKELAERILQSPIENLRNATLNGDNALLLAVNSLFSLKVKD